jgi:hypothetical protein
MRKHPTYYLVPVAVLFYNYYGKRNKATKKRVIRIICCLKSEKILRKTLIFLYTTVFRKLLSF